MYFIVPFGIFLVSLFGIVWLVSRKFVYLKKLSPEVIEGSNGGNSGFWAEFFPGIAAKLEKSRWHKYRILFLAESEKFLRKLRLISLKIDTSTNRLINQIRKSLIHHEKLVNGVGGGVEVQGEPEVKPNVLEIDKLKVLREDEQKLIIEIAKNPRDSELYKELAKIYIKVGETIDAVESFKKALELDPGDDAVRARLEKLKQRLAKNTPA